MSNITVTGTLTDRPVAAQTINFRRVAQIPTGWSADPVAFSTVSDASGAWSVSLPTNRTGDEYWVARVAGSPAETWFYLSPTAASPSTIDAVEVKALTDLPDVAPADEGGGTVDTSGLLPIADPRSVATEQIPAPFGSGQITCLVFPADASVLAIKIEGDAHPRFLLTADGEDGMYFGDGTIDPFQDGPEIAYGGPGYGLGISGGTGNPAYAAHGDGYYDRAGTGPVVLSPDGTTYRIKVANDGTVSAEVATGAG